MATSSLRSVRGFASVKVYGLSELLAKLEAINLVARIQVGFSMAAAAEEILKLAIDNAPHATGNLEGSGKVQHVGPYTHLVAFNTTWGPVGEKNNIDYAGYVEFGTSQQDGQPFLQPAMEAVIPMVNADLVRIAAMIEAL